MRLLRVFIAKLTGIGRRKQREKELEDEIAANLEIAAAEGRAREALIQLGGWEGAREAWREQRGFGRLESWLLDMRHAWRQIRRWPLANLAAVVSLAAAIGLITAVFSVADAVVLRPLPVRAADALVTIQTSSSKTSGDALSWPEYLDLTKQEFALRGVLADGERGAIVKTPAAASMAEIGIVSSNYFSVLGLQPALGRFFTPAGSPAAAAREVVISYSLWRKMFSGNPAWIGRPIQLDDRLFTLIGVAPPDFHGLQSMASTAIWAQPEVWQAMIPGSAREFTDRRDRWFTVMGRIAPGSGIARARIQADAIAARLARAYPATEGDRRFDLLTAWDQVRSGIAPVLIGLGLAGFVLLIACANIASLLLVRCEQRRQEFALMAAMGASRGRLLSQVAGQAVLLVVPAAVLGIAGAGTLLRAIPAWIAAGQLGININAALDRRVLLFAVFASLLTLLMVTVLPALRSSHSDPAPALKGEPMLTQRRGRPALNQFLVAGQIALALALVASAGLLLRSLADTLAVPLGFNPHRRVLILGIAPPELYGYNQRQSLALYQNLAAKLQAQPGAMQVSFARRPLLTDDEGGELVKVSLPAAAGKGSASLPVRYNVVSPGFFATMGTPWIAGRDFNRDDSRGTPDVVIINHLLAARLWPAGNALGQWLRVGNTSARIVGVVGTGKYQSLQEVPQPYLFFPFLQRGSEEGSVFVQTADSSPELQRSLLRVARASDGEVPIYDVSTLRQEMTSYLFPNRAAAWLSGVLGVLGMLLAGIGLYALVAFTAARRTHEIGIRMALGARPTDVLRTMLAQSLRLALGGIAAGTALTFLLGPLLRAILFGVAPSDPLSLLCAALLIAVLALAATLVPALRAMRINPTEALRME